MDFNVPQGRDFQLRLTNGQGLTVDEEPDFPYNLGGVAFITKSTALSNPQSKYYYFYDWVIHHVHACQRTPIHLEMQASENPPSAAFTPSATIVNIGALENIEFSNSSSNSVEYLWNFGDGTTSTEEHPQHSYSSPGLYTVSLAAINADGCTDIEIVEIEAVLATATNNQKANNQIKVFPNPTKDLILSLIHI